jgi:hypothetical protein
MISSIKVTPKTADNQAVWIKYSSCENISLVLQRGTWVCHSVHYMPLVVMLAWITFLSIIILHYIDNLVFFAISNTAAISGVGFEIMQWFGSL